MSLTCQEEIWRYVSDEDATTILARISGVPARTGASTCILSGGEGVEE